ncbi:MAG: deoxyribodipyrimidine photo-lyase [Alphaproteobacteria bacterium]|jgi:deoxyribodipyrimidine photo-lyase|nr:deoxyribodipyrimidine photo-lyase [Alphaproteobacteria bacterium]
MSDAVILWFRQDLRIADNPALDAALQSRKRIIPLFILDDDSDGMRRLGAASRWWLHGGLAALAKSLEKCGSRLILRRGPADAVIDALLDETGATAIVWNRCYEPEAIARDRALKSRLKERGIAACSHQAALLFEPWTVKTQNGEPYRVYTPFWKACKAKADIAPPLPAPESLPAPAAWPTSETLEDWHLRPTQPDWAGGLRETWRPGEHGAQERLAAFLEEGLGTYADRRNRPDIAGTSRLSPHLHWGEIGPRQIWAAVEARRAAGDLAGREKQAETFLKEVVWREFSYHLLYHFPTLPESPLNPRFAAFPWGEDEKALAAWQAGRTGYPIVDAGMRQLWHTGWLHNRVRMIVASFLVKDLMLPWQAGEAWFWDTLVDADLANNAASWQWVAGCGADAAPYFRIFNPVLQGEKFDPDGTYVRHWVPELAGLPATDIHKPWTLPADRLDKAGIRLGETYPAPIVDHHAARHRALAAFETIKA